MNKIVSSAIELIGSDAGGISLLDESTSVINIPLVYNLPDALTGIRLKLDADIFSNIITTGKTQRIDDYRQTANKINELDSAGVRAIALVPLRARNKIMGALWVCMLRPDRAFSDYSMALLESLGGQAAVAIDNINLFNEERYISETLQRGFIPERLPELKHTDIGVYYASATAMAVVGGDFYDAVQMPGEQISLFVGDVSGKGVEATADAAMVKYTLRAISYQNSKPADILTIANTIIARQLTSGHFVTAAYCSYNSDNGEAIIGLAGHPYPLLYSKTNGKVSQISDEGPAFTVIPNYKYTDYQALLSPGDILALYTDGIIELRQEKEFLGIERLGELVVKYAGLSAQEIADNMMDDAKEFARGRLTDDIVLMIIKRTG